jgi:hypothetical protein
MYVKWQKLVITTLARGNYDLFAFMYEEIGACGS